ncbi:MAG TPA: uroporphyrinogen-III synthase [Stellaceae bacterium]|nr:uroporphyrinogen-III synthase [Stellaceae bacterium]
MRVAVTRQQADGERSAAALRARGHDVLLAPLMRVEPIAADLAGTWSGIAITSANALVALNGPREFLTLPLFAVGARSAEAARAAGFTQAIAAEGNVDDLVRLIAERHRGPTPLLYLAGEDRAADLIGALARHRIAAEMRVVYRAVTAPLPPALIAALRGRVLDAVLHYSQRGAESYLAGARAAGIEAEALAVRHVCLSAQVAAPLQVAGASRIAVAKHPDEAALIELLGMSGR